MSVELSLYPHQRDAVAYLKSRHNAALWDEQRVGKTGPAIVASGELGLERVKIITTVAGVGVWKHQWRQWDRWNRLPIVVPWSQIANGRSVQRALDAPCDVLIFDEGHYAKSFGAARTRRAYGVIRGYDLDNSAALTRNAGRIWHLTGTPSPHDPGDLFSVLKALFPEILEPNPKQGFPDVRTFEKFRGRYCVVVMQRIKNRLIPVVVRGQHTDELKRRLQGVFLRRRQKDVGIKPAFWDLLPVAISPGLRARMFAAIDDDAIKRALRPGGGGIDFSALEPMLAPIRRITGTYKATAVVADAVDFLEGNREEKLVVAYWHKDVGDVLERGLGKFGATRVDGSIIGPHRDQKVARFQSDGACRVFLAQIAACGEAIDLSAAAEMWFAESTFTPAQMAQMGSRITNLNQPRQCLVRVCALEDTIDETIQDRLIDLSRSIAHTLGETYNENFAARRV